MKYPALVVRGADPDFVLAIVDDFSPTAVEETAEGTSIFFTSADRRASAHAALAAQFPGAVLSLRDVDDEDWARRSQQNLTAIVIGFGLTAFSLVLAHRVHATVGSDDVDDVGRE